MNKQGTRTVGLTAKLQEARGFVEAVDAEEAEAASEAFPDLDLPPDYELDEDATRIIEALDELIAAGDEWSLFWRDAVHGVSVPAPSEARQIRKEWEDWGRVGMNACRRLGIPISRLGGFTGRI
jgi:hypothetical protein